MRRNEVIRQAGHTLIELLVAMGLLALLLPVLLSSLSITSQSEIQHQKRQQAQVLLNQSIEALRTIRASGWAAVSTPGTYHGELVSNQWQLASASAQIGDFTVQVQLSAVQRNDDGTIVSNGSWVDPSTMQVDYTVAWEDVGEQNLTSTGYITRYLDNQEYIETTEADFLSGTLTSTAVTNTAGGEVILGSGGQGDWCKPAQFIVAELDLPGSGSARDVEAIEGKAFTGTDSGSGSFAEIAISNDLPPNVNIESLLTGYQTNDVFIDANYAYVATEDISRDVIIIDLTTGQEVGYFNDPAWGGTAQGVYVVGNVGYVTIGPRLHTFDLTQKTGSRPELDREYIEGGILGWFATGYRLQVVGDYAYVTVNIGWAELRLMNVANPSNIKRAARADVNGERGQEVFVNETGTRAYLATTSSGSKDELFVINTGVSSSNKNNSSYYLPVISSYDANGMDPRGVRVVPGNRALLVGVGGEEYQVIDTSDEQHLTRCGGFDVDTGIYGVAAVLESDDDAYSYVVTASPTSEFKVIQGGPGASLSSEGWFESQPLDTNYDSGFNYFSYTGQTPNNTTLELQVAGADASAGSCDNASYTFVGPDKSESSVYTGPDIIPFDNDGGGYENPARCFKYRAHLLTDDGTNTPVLEQVQLNYSP